jgi:sn-glycerol 3-phosphate transport system substrate-binding protein
MKKTLAMIVTLVMLISMLPAAIAEGDPITIKFWHTRGSGANYEVTQYSVNKFNETIGKEKGIVVEEVFIGNYNEILSKTQLAIQSGEAPQVVVSGNTFVSYLLEDEVLADMAPLAEATGWDKSNLLQPFQEINGNTNGTLYTLPYIRSTPMFYYNKTMADAKGLTAPTTVEEMVEFCKALWQKDDAGNTTVYGMLITNDFGYLNACHLYQMGSAFLSEDGTSSPALEDGSMLKVLSDWRSWIDEGWCSPYDATNAGTVMSEMFTQQKLGAMLTSSGSLASVLKNAKEAGFEVGVCQYPTYDAEKRIAEIGGGNLCIISEGNTDEQVAASWEFVQFLMSDEMVTYNTTQTGYVPTTYSVAEYEGMKSFWAENPLYQVAYEQVKTGRCQENPYSPYLQDFTQACWDAVSLLIQDKSINAEQAVEHIKTNSAEFFN